MPQRSNSFFSLYSHGFARVATATPKVVVAEPVSNVERTIAAARIAHDRHAAVVLFPELGLSGYAIDDLHQQSALLDAVEAAIEQLRAASESIAPLIVVGAPLRQDDALFNCAVAVHRGRILGVVPKSYLPNYREFYEARQFAPASHARSETIVLGAEAVPFGTDLLVRATDLPDLVVGIEICEDVWVPVPPSAYAAMAGATVLLNLSASNVTIGKSEWRHTLCRAHSGRCFAAYLYSAAGPGESTTDLAWDGHAMIYENGVLLAETERFSPDAQVVFADVDLERLRQERMRAGTFGDCARATMGGQSFRTVGFALGLPSGKAVPLDRAVARFPFVPDDRSRLAELCYEAYNIQVDGLKKRLEATGIEKVVIGVSGGLDSTQALLVAAQTFDTLKLPRQNMLAYTLPAFATSDGTKRNAWALMRALGVTAKEIDMEPVSRQTLTDIGHPFATGKPVYDVTFENVQAGARTATLFRLANMENAIVLGTGDLSELALGWCTYGVGDHMSHYNVNASVPKTLIQHLIRWVAREERFGADVRHVLEGILDTEISPELIPGASKGEAPHQRTEDVVGPYALQDFHLYYVTRFGFRPSKVAFLAHHAWGDAAAGTWPDAIPADKRVAYELPVVRRWLRVFLSRFFGSSQFKRSALPNGPKVTSGGSLSPRGDWRAPSDASPAVWLAELDRNVPDETRR